MRKLAVIAALLSVVLLTMPLALARPNDNPGILPVGAKLYGKTYGEWAAEWSQWLIGIPAESNPALDTTGGFADVDQSGPVWFLAGTFGGSAQRTVTVPAGKWLFFPLDTYISWAPGDLGAAAFVAETFYGLDPDDLTAEQLIRLYASFNLVALVDLSCTIDGVQVQHLEQYRASSPAFRITDADLLDDFGIPPSDYADFAVSDGYWIMLAPPRRGQHTIHFTAGSFLDVTYYLTVK
jgi:hypothetical protein